jgi:hypothetical protein
MASASFGGGGGSGGGGNALAGSDNPVRWWGGGVTRAGVAMRYAHARAQYHVRAQTKTYLSMRPAVLACTQRSIHVGMRFPLPAGQAGWTCGVSTAPMAAIPTGGQKRVLWRHVDGCTSTGAVSPIRCGGPMYMRVHEDFCYHDGAYRRPAGVVQQSKARRAGVL